MRTRLANIALQYASYHAGEACVLSYLQRLSCILNNRQQDTLHHITTFNQTTCLRLFSVKDGQDQSVIDRASDQTLKQQAVDEQPYTVEQGHVLDKISEAVAEEARQKAWDEEDDNDKLTTGPEGQGDLEPPSFLEVLGGAAASSITAVAVAGVGMITMLLLSNWVIQVVKNLKQQPANQEATSSTGVKAGVSNPVTDDKPQAPSSTIPTAVGNTQATSDTAKSSQAHIKLAQEEQSNVLFVPKQATSRNGWWQRMSSWFDRKSRPVTQTTAHDGNSTQSDSKNESSQNPNPA